MSDVQFWKMHGLGNDYIVIDNRDGKICDHVAAVLAKKLCERRFSVGADGLLLVCASKMADVKMRIFNSDGSEAEMCGNGIRCFSKYCYETGILKKSVFQVETLSGVKDIWLTLNGDEVLTVKVDMGVPSWSRKSLPMLGEGTCINEGLVVGEVVYNVTCLSVGNPHCIIFVENVNEAPIESIGPLVENHTVFPNRVNVVFVQVVGRGELRVRVWERACGETLACGTGACAAVVAANKLGKVDCKVSVRVLGGDLQVEIGEKGLFIIGATKRVYQGVLFGED